MGVKLQISFTKRSVEKKRLTVEVADGLQSLLLAHHEANTLLSLVAHEFGIADATLFPLLVPVAVELDSHLEDALEVLSTRLHCLHIGNVNLIAKSKHLTPYLSFGFFVLVLHVVFRLLLNLLCHFLILI